MVSLLPAWLQHRNDLWRSNAGCQLDFGPTSRTTAFHAGSFSASARCPRISQIFAEKTATSVSPNLCPSVLQRTRSDGQVFQSVDEIRIIAEAFPTVSQGCGDMLCRNSTRFYRVDPNKSEERIFYVENDVNLVAMASASIQDSEFESAPTIEARMRKRLRSEIQIGLDRRSCRAPVTQRGVRMPEHDDATKTNVDLRILHSFSLAFPCLTLGMPPSASSRL